MKDELPLGVDAPPIARAEPLAHVGRKRPRGRDVPTQCHARIRLVHALTAGTTAATPLEAELANRRADLGIVGHRPKIAPIADAVEPEVWFDLPQPEPKELSWKSEWV